MKLTDPYPICPDFKKSLVTALLISIFVTAFLSLFQPFGSHNIPGEMRYWIFAGYGMVNFVVLMINMIIIPIVLQTIFSEKSWKVYKEFLWIAWILITIGVGNFLYTKLLLDYPDSYLQGFLMFQLYTLAIGIFPVIILIILNYNRHLHNNLQYAGRMNEMLGKGNVTLKTWRKDIIIDGENQNETLQLQLDRVLYIQSEGNYINIYYRDDKGIKRSILRNTLKGAEKQLNSSIPPLFRTHRSFIVNLGFIDKIKGNSQGLQLYLPELDEFIPVSRTYIHKFQEAIRKLKT